MLIYQYYVNIKRKTKKVGNSNNRTKYVWEEKYTEHTNQFVYACRLMAYY